MSDHVIAHGEQRATVSEAGATLRSYDVGGRAVIDGYGAGEMSPAGHGQVLAPWPNRVDGGRYLDAQGAEHQLPINEVAHGNAIHGLVRWMPWQVAARSEQAITMECRLFPSPGYPFDLLLQVAYALQDDGLRCTVTARNLGGRAAPYGIGHHPYLACPGDRADDAVLHVPAQAVLEHDERMLPTGREIDIAGTAYDFRVPRRVDDTRLDDTYTQLIPDADGLVRCSVGDGAAWRTTLWMQPPLRWVQVFTSDILQPPRRRRAIALEPMSCPPNALRSGADLILLQPGEQAETTWGLQHTTG